MSNSLDPDEDLHSAGLVLGLNCLQSSSADDKIRCLQAELEALHECGNTMPDLLDLVPFHSGQVRNFYLHVTEVSISYKF